MAWKLNTETFAFVVPLRLTNPILCKKLFAQSLLRNMCPPLVANELGS